MTVGGLLVVGSTNIDLSVAVDHVPATGETVLAHDATDGLGGKGANQACAAARAGARVAFATALGADGDAALDQLRSAGVEVTHVQRVAARTGRALVTVTPDGQNTIVIVPGASSMLDPQHVAHAIGTTEASTVLAQCEIRGQVVVAAARTARRRGLRFVLNLSPATVLPVDVLADCDPVVVNETEAAALVGYAVADLDTATQAARDLARRARTVVITLGADGAVVVPEPGEPVHVAGHRVPVIDTTGAGDAFVGVLAAELASGASLIDAVRAGNAAGAAAVQVRGAQPTTLTDLEEAPL
ncbi:PfkB family carbohydrate kinase [Cellulosimicrobium sp. 22601]|uniref:PfkB family carbohydrate kinase n=1 Tax=unclassified Cellulosimicrobium TaxID=2624466 RepID=UPI003F8545C1